MSKNARLVALGLDLLDRQLIDKNGIACGKVDDLKLESSGGTDVLSSPPPFVTALLVGPGALEGRSPARLGRWIAGVWRRLHPDRDPHPVEIAWRHVAKLDYAVNLDIDEEEAGLSAVKRWVWDKVTGRLPGT